LLALWRPDEGPLLRPVLGLPVGARMTFVERLALRILIDRAVRAREDDPTRRRCFACTRWLDVHDFSPSNWRGGGRCRACAGANSRAYYRKAVA